jgi:hypothetical protein
MLSQLTATRERDKHPSVGHVGTDWSPLRRPAAITESAVTDPDQPLLDEPLLRGRACVVSAAEPGHHLPLGAVLFHTRRIECEPSGSCQTSSRKPVLDC